jgi:hypothetical protein
LSAAATSGDAAYPTIQEDALLKRSLATLAVLAASIAALTTTAAAAAPACGASAQGTYVGTVTVNSANPSGASLALPASGQYTLVACGTWQNTTNNVADAEYTSRDGWATYEQGYDFAPYFLGPDFADLEVNNAFVDWGTYSASHVYTLTGAFSGTLNLSVFDGDGNAGPLAKSPGWYGDNAGSLSVDVYRSLPTSADQCKNGGWQAYGVFKNQGDCVSYVATHGKNQPG